MRIALFVVLACLLAGCWLEPVPGPDELPDAGAAQDGGSL